MTFSTLASPGVSLQGGGGSGGGGTPGGSTTQIQYNNAGAFAGASGLTTNGTNLTLGSASQLLWSTDLILTRRGAANLRFGAADAAAPVAQTLSVQSVVAGTSNTAGTSLTITGSQGTGTGAGGSIIFQVAPLGSSGSAQNALATALTINADKTASFAAGAAFASFAYFASTKVAINQNGTGDVTANAAGEFSFGSTGVNSPDVFLTRRAAASLRFGAADAAAPVAQTLSVQSVVAGTTNTAGANLTITGSQGTGTGAGGSIIFQVAPLGSSGSAQNALATALTLNSSQQAVFAAGSKTVPTVSFTGFNGGLYGRTSGALSLTNGSVEIGLITGNGTSFLSSIGLSTGAGSGGDLSVAGADTILARDAANTLALRNGTAAQAFNVYNTYTSDTSYERYSVDWITTANLVIVGPNKGSGGGTQRVQRLSYLENGGAGSTVPLLGSTCPAASGTVKSWIKVITSDGTTAYVPCWA